MTSDNFEAGFNGWMTDNGTETAAPDDPVQGTSLRGSEGGSGVWHFVAPTAYLGDKSALYGGTLTYKLKQDIDVSQFDESDVVMTGAGLRLVVDAGPNPGTDWTDYEVDFALGGGWKISDLDGAVATEAQIRAVLADLTELKIRGEFVNGVIGDASNIDDIATTEGPPDQAVFTGVQITSTFEEGPEGWSFIEDVSEFRHLDADGNPGGYIEAEDQRLGDIWSFSAPEEYLGDKSAFIGGRLSFDLRQSSLDNQIDHEDVVLQGGGLTLAYDTTDNPGTDWTSYSIRLDTTADWTLDDLSGAQATPAEFARVMSRLEAIYIRGEFINGADTGGLDTVALTSPGARVGVLASVEEGGLLSSHRNVTSAVREAEAGNVIQVAVASGFRKRKEKVDVNDVTVLSDLSLDGKSLKMVDIRKLSVSGETDLSVIGTGKTDRILGSEGDNTLNGKNGRDRLEGAGGDDVLLGGKGADRLFGGDGDDRIVGAKGNDRARGNDGDDTFVFAGEWGNDRVLDFELGDTVAISGRGEARSFAQFEAASTQSGKTMVYDAGSDGANVIRFKGVTIDSFDSGSFDFG